MAGTTTDVIQGQSSLDWVMETGKDGTGQARRGRINNKLQGECVCQVLPVSLAASVMSLICHFQHRLREKGTRPIPKMKLAVEVHAADSY